MSTSGRRPISSGTSLDFIALILSDRDCCLDNALATPRLHCRDEVNDLTGGFTIRLFARPSDVRIV